MSLPEKNDYNSLGGELIDYSPVEDPSTDLAAEASNEMRCDIAAMTQTAIRAWVGFSVDGYGDPVVGNTEQDYGAVYGRAIEYKPEILKSAPGTYTIIFPETIIDARGFEKSLNIQCGFGNCESTEQLTSVKRIASNMLNLFLWNTTDGSFTDPSLGDKVFVFIL